MVRDRQQTVNPYFDKVPDHSAMSLKPWLETLAYPFRLFTRRARIELSVLRHPSRFLTQTDLIQRLDKLRQGRTRCHIVCGGHSAPATVGQIEDNDFVLGFGYAGLLDLNFDAYFFEVASTGNSWDQLVTRVFASFYDQILRHRAEELFFKNYWNGRVNIDCMASIYDPFPLIAMDVQLPVHSLNRPAILDRLICKSLLNARSRSLSQTGGSVMTMIALAIKAGAKDIIVHGLDVSGPHFYATPGWEIPGFLLDAGFRGIYPVQKDYNHPHRTKMATDILIPLLKKHTTGVEIRRAVQVDR